MKSPDLIEAIKPVIYVFDNLLIPYYIGGSVASSVYGIARATLDIDIVADIKTENISGIMNELKSDYYIDQDMIKNAILNKSTFNLIHLQTMIKIDVFIYNNDLYGKESMRRKRLDTIEDDKSILYSFSSPEDIILNKLLWYKKGNQISDRQWSDVTGVIKIQSNSLDKLYLIKWANELNIMDLLEKAFTDAGEVL